MLVLRLAWMDRPVGQQRLIALDGQGEFTHSRIR